MKRSFGSGSPESELQVPLDSPVTSRGKVHVLVVDDEKMIRSLLKMSLQRMGYEVTTADDGAEVRHLADCCPLRPCYALCSSFAGSVFAIRRLCTKLPECATVDELTTGSVSAHVRRGWYEEIRGQHLYEAFVW